MQADCKPSSVLHPAFARRSGDHSSRLRVAPELKRPTRKLLDGPSMTSCDVAFPYLALLHVGFAQPIRCRTAGALLPHLFTLTGVRGQKGARGLPPRPLLTPNTSGMFSVALSVPYGPSDYEAHCPVEFGLSSLNRS